MCTSLDAAALNTGGISSAIEAGRVNLANDAEHLELSKARLLRYTRERCNVEIRSECVLVVGISVLSVLEAVLETLRVRKRSPALLPAVIDQK